MHQIVFRNEKYAVGPENARGFKLALRGLYYLSPFIRDFQNCKELKEMFKNIIGEEIIPHPSFSNVPQVYYTSPPKKKYLKSDIKMA